MKSLQSSTIFLIILSFLLITSAQNLSPSQTKTLFRLQRILEFNLPLSEWNQTTNLCYSPPSSFSISCSGNRVTELSINANRTTSLSASFNIDSFFTTLFRLPNLTTLSLVNVGLWGPLPAKVDRFDSLKVLNLSSNYLHGNLPMEIGTMTSLESLVLSDNSFNGTAPDFKNLALLKELDLSRNSFGPKFPSMPKSLLRLVLKNNTFEGSIPMSLSSFDQLQNLDLSYNQLKGKIPPSLFSLRGIRYLDLSGNSLSGALPKSLSCGDKLQFVDISRNRLVGGLPSCIRSNSSSMLVLDEWNCLSSGDSRYQNPNSHCNDGALAAFLPPADKNEKSKSQVGLILGIVGGIIGGAVVLGLVVFIVFRKAKSDSAGSFRLTKPVMRKASVQVSPRSSPPDTRHMSQAVRIGTLGLTPYRVFTMEELDEATYSFDPSNLISDGPQGQVYKGWIQDGSTVVVRRLTLKQKLSHQSLIQYMDVISRLRHINLVSILGHCITNGQENANTTTNIIFLVMENVSNGTLRSHLNDWRKREMLKWPQRVAAAIGVARGIQFLHSVAVPGIVGNDLSIENILLDETLTAKISNYNLPMLSKNKSNKGGFGSPFNGLEESDTRSGQSLENGEKEDVRQLGQILLELITGRFAGSKPELDALKDELQESLTDGPAKLRAIIDPAIRGTFAFDSLRTLVAVALNCVSEDHSERPSIDDILWNLQYSVQVQDGWASSESLSIHSY